MKCDNRTNFEIAMHSLDCEVSNISGLLVNFNEISIDDANYLKNISFQIGHLIENLDKKLRIGGVV